MKKLHGPIAPEERGALLEGWVLHFLRTYAEEGALVDDLHYWAPQPANRTEANFPLDRGGAWDLTLPRTVRQCVGRNAAHFSEVSSRVAEAGDGYAIGEEPGVAGPARQHSENFRRRLWQRRRIGHRVSRRARWPG